MSSGLPRLSGVSAQTETVGTLRAKLTHLRLLYRAQAARTRGGRPEESHRRAGPGGCIDRSTGRAGRCCIGLLRRGGLCGERDAQRRRGRPVRSSTGVRPRPGLQLQDVRLREDGHVVTCRTPRGSARSRAAVRRQRPVGAGLRRDPFVLRVDQRELAVGEPRRYTSAAAVHRPRMHVRTGLSPVRQRIERRLPVPGVPHPRFSQVGSPRRAPEGYIEHARGRRLGSSVPSACSDNQLSL